MKERRRHNNRGQQQVRTGKTREQVEKIARRLGVGGPEKTYWNYEPTPCRRVLVRVAERQPDDPPLLWSAGLEGTERRAVEVSYGGALFYLDDDDVPQAVFDAAEAREQADPKMQALRAMFPNPRNRQPGKAGDGWEKVTKGRGGPEWGHRSLRVAEVIREI